MRFRIVQCLCGPRRHAILAMALNVSVDDTSNAEALTLLRGAVAAALGGPADELGLSQLDPWCGLCGAPAGDWTYEIGWSRAFQDWDAAQQVLRQCEADQRATAALLELLDATYNARMRDATARHVADAHRGSH